VKNVRNDVFQEEFLYPPNFPMTFLVIFSHFLTSPIFAKCIHLPLFRENLHFPYFRKISVRSIYVSYASFTSLAFPYFDHDAFMHHALHVVNWTPLPGSPFACPLHEPLDSTRE